MINTIEINKSVHELLELISQVVRKKLSIDEVLESEHRIEDYKITLSYLNGCLRSRRFRSENRWHSYMELYDYICACELLLDAMENRNELSLESKQENVSEGPIELSMDWDLVDEDETIADSIEDGLVLSLANKAKVDIPYIARISGHDGQEVIRTLKGVIYQDPDLWNEDPLMGWQTSDEYLSGNMSVKLKKAKQANLKYPGVFKNNISAINRIYPKVVEPDDIYITLGSPWIPTDIIDDFIVHLFGQSKSPTRMAYLTKHDKISGTWTTTNGSRYSQYNVAFNKTWGTSRSNALHILENTLNMHKPMIYDTRRGYKSDGSYGDIRVLNKEETALAQEKQKQMVTEFQRWVWDDPERRKRLLQIYEDSYASFVRRKYDGSFLSFPGMSDKIELFDYQKNAVARILFAKNVLLAHDVGTGKTYEMVAAGMELKRIGLSRKNLYVVPNNILGQWESDFKKIYPEAKLLVIGPKNFTKAKKKKSLELIRENDYDGIIMACSCFDALPLSADSLIAELEEEKAKISKAQTTVTGNVSILEQRKSAIKKQLLALKLKGRDEDELYFDDLGIDRLFVDEAHNYKNVPIKTKMSAVLGVSANGSKKCKDMLDKVKYIQKHHNGGGVVMASGTPITNSISEVYVLQLYLQRGELSLLDLESFDSWAGMFAETVSDYEFDVASNSYRYATRFCKFHNLPELTNLLSNIADFHKADAQSGIPVLDGYSDVQIRKGDEFAKALEEISQRADKVRGRQVKREEDNMLKITTDGRKAALDLRLLDEDLYHYNPESKAASCADNIYREYCEGLENKSTQLVFCDSSTPKAGFNMYDELSRILTAKGIPESEIAYIHDAATDKQRDELYKKVRNGEVRILIGSTFKLGLGVNVQEKIKALHHLDIPWRPADMTQREGRILRQGNLNKTVNIYRYVTEGSFDAYSWQLLETKQKFISDLLSGALEDRDGDEVDNVVLSYGEIKALAIGNPLIRDRVEIINEISRLRLLRKRSIEIRLDSEKELLELPSRIEAVQESIRKAKDDQHYIDELDLDHDRYLSVSQKEESNAYRDSLRRKIDDALSNNIQFPEERKLLDYNGFTIYLPAYMSNDTPYLIAERKGRYHIDMGNSFKGNLIRLDNFFTAFQKVVNEYKDNLKKLKTLQKDLETELLRKEDFSDRIDLLKIQLTNINERLGINYE